MEDYRKRALVGKKERQEKATFTLPEGKTRFRILKTPGDDERKSPEAYIEYYMHYNVGPKKFRIRCGIDPSGLGECWLCEKIEKEKQKGHTKLAEALQRKKTFEVQVAVWDEDLEGLTGPKRWVSSGNSQKGVPFKLLSILANEKADRYLSHKNGYCFTIDRSGTGMTDTVYSAPERDEEPMEVPKEIVRKLKPFADIVPQYDEDYQKNAYYGKEEESDEEEETKPKRRSSVDEDEEEEVVVKKKRRVVEEDEEAEEDALEEEDDLKFGDDDEDEPKPKKKVKVVEPDEAEEEEEAPKPKKRKVVVEEDEDEDEPKPKKKGSGKKVVVDEEDELELEEDVEPEVEEDDDDEPKTKKKAKYVEPDEEEEEEKPRKRVVKDEDEEEEDEPKPKKKVRYVEPEEEEEEEEEPKPKRRK